MKKTITLLGLMLLMLTPFVNAQTNSTGKYYYAEVQVHTGGFNKHKSTSLSFGNDYTIKAENKAEMENKVSTLKEGVDIKNYMSDKGWDYVDVQNMLFNDMLIVYTFRIAK